MSDKQYTNGDLVDTIENEGLEYAVRHYCDERHIEDKLTGVLWRQAADSLNLLVNRLKAQTGRDFD